LAKRKTKRNADGSIVRVLTNSAEYGVIDQKDYFEKDIAIQGNLESYFVVDHGDYVYNPRVSVTAPVGPIGKNKVGLGVMSPLYTVFGFNCEDQFYEHFFRSSLWHPYMRFVSNSGARHDRMAASSEDFMRMPVPAPWPGEQQKIAECLSSLDALIDAETDKLTALRGYRKGLMQQLFPAEGETIPRLRFPEFQETREWDEITLQSALEAPATYGIVKAGDFQPTGIRMVRGGDIKGGAINKDLPLVSAEIHQEYRRTIIQKDDVLIALVGYPGEAAVVPEELAGSNVSRAVGLLRPAVGLNPDFLASYLNSDKGRREVLAPSAGSAQLVVNLGALNALKLTLPDLAEQGRISRFFSTLNEKLSAQSDLLGALRAHKSGLMQQLFPSPVEALA
jgi:type I restriction enzyme S subunit